MLNIDFWDTGGHNTGNRNTGDWNTGACLDQSVTQTKYFIMDTEGGYWKSDDGMTWTETDMKEVIMEKGYVWLVRAVLPIKSAVQST